MADSRATPLPRLIRSGAGIVFLLLLPVFWASRGQAQTLEVQQPLPQATFVQPPDEPNQPQIDPRTPVEKLLPMPPTNQAKPVLINDLKQVPEVAFERPPGKKVNAQQAMADLRKLIAGIHHVNKQKTDAYMTALVQRRPDLAGLPFVMGEACRQKDRQRETFFTARSTVVQQMGQGVSVPITEADQAPRLAADQFWENLHMTERQMDRDAREKKIDLSQARVAALMQVCGPMSDHMRFGLVRYLASVSHADATRALARMALFTEEDPIRTAAVEALKVRRERDYTDILVHGLNYPLPAVNKRASEAIAKLQRTDLAANLVALLDEADPRAPRAQKIDGREVPVIRELVKINHHRNCLMCHAPGDANITQARFRQIRVQDALTGSLPVERKVLVQEQVAPEPEKSEQLEADSSIVVQTQTVTGAVPIPGHPLPSLAGGYQSDTPDIFVRVDVTYLRQDFSLMLPVADAHPWPQMQRFDFLVRNRRLTEQEAQEFGAAMKQAGPSPYRENALIALRELTGQNAEPNAAAWRRVLKLP